MPYVDHAKNLMIAADGITHLSLHTAYSATGANEATGGSPAYARQACAFDSAANGEKSLTGTEVFDVPSGTYEYVGAWDAVTAGNFKGMFPLGGGAANPPKTCIGRDTGDLIEATAHGLSNDDRVAFFGAGLATGLTAGTVYHVISANANDFQVSTTQGGSAVTITADGVNMIYQKVVPETFGAQGTLTINELTLGLNLVTT